MDQQDDYSAQPEAEAAGVAVSMGLPMPSPEQVPVLLEGQTTPEPAVQGDEPKRHSKIGQGLSFTGSADIAGSLTIAGEVMGDVHVAESASAGHVTITETGTVVGDIRARNISVLGSSEGLLDAGGGKVSLHSTACVSGRIRYTHLQVNGADLNAQLERVRPDGERAGKPN
jgi:cytoskeletal protein CcmA (bactofilin family)